MRLHATSHRFIGQHVDTAATTRRAECALAAAVLLLAALAVGLPASALPAGYHDFADQRAWGGLPHALDVLTNLPFALMGAWGWAALRRLPAGRVGAAPRALAGVFFAGLLLTALCSSAYHWAPDHAGLCLDRVGARAGLALAATVAVAAPAAALLDAWTGNMTPWAVLQGGGLVLLAALALRPPRGGALGFSIGAVIALYALAKALELADQPVFALTQGLLSGHSAKHLVAALAAWPVLRAVQRAGRQGRGGAALTIR